MQASKHNNPTPTGELALKLIPQINETNLHGDISAGWVMRNMDVAGEQIASTRACGRVAGVAFESVIFMSPIQVGANVCFYTRLLEIGTSSIKVGIEVWTYNPKQTEAHKVVDAVGVYVAIADNGGIRSLPKLET